MHTETSKSLVLHLLLALLLFACFVAFPIRVQAGQDTPAECLFNWAELNYPALLAPAGSPMQFWTVYSYRHYPATNAYLGINSVNNHLYYMGKEGVLQDVGPLTDWSPKAGCPVPPPSPAECLFNWAELNYPGLFAPIEAPWTVSSIDWTSRYYSSTNAYLRIQSSDNHVYYRGPDGLSQDVGPLSDWTPKAFCRPPVANAGPEQTAFVGSTVTLDGSASSDLDGNLITYHWTLAEKPAGSQTALSNSTALHPTLAIDKPGTYVISLVVNDGQFDSAPDTVTINTQNSKPVANAGTDQSGKVGDTLVLNGSASQDTDGDVLTYHWTLPVKPRNSIALLNNPDSVNPSLALDKPGSYTAQLTINDGKADSIPATVVLSTINSRPVAKAGPAQSLLLTTPAPSVLLDGSGSSDADNDPLSFRWALISKPAGSLSELLDPLTPSARFIPDFVGDYVAQLIVNDGHADSDPNTAQITVLAPPQNHPPQFTSAPVTTAMVGNSYSYDADAGDSDNDTLTYSLKVFPGGMTINAQTGVISWIPAAGQTGNQSVTVNVIDGKGGSDSQSFSITVVAADQTTVPNLVDQNRASAETAIQQAKLNIGTLIYQHNAKADGNVINQSPAAGDSVKIGTAVNLTVSIGPDNGLPPNPATVAPALDQTIATTTYAASQFLYTGSNPVQTGVQPGAIEAKRAAVLRGKVLDKQNKPLSGVTVNIKDHPELGQTQTRTDGQYDLAVNGGGLVTLNYVKTSFLPAQRQVETPWQDDVIMGDVNLIQPDSKVTTVDFSGAAAFQSVQANPVTDADGTRRATLLIPPGTTAQIYNTDGTTKTVNSLHLRLTEYTVGENGPETMPASLPASSGYTYALEISADEAPVKIAGKDVLLNQPAYLYLENFLGFPTGIQVPMGYYDREKSAWIPSPDGRIIQIISISNGLAELDTDADGVADNGIALGIRQEERQQLAGLYTAGQSLERVPVYHFSTHDPNYGIYCGTDSNGNPFQCTIDKPKVQENSLIKKSTTECGSIIECENQTLGETISLTGSQFTLNYRSDRVIGRSTQRTVTIPISAATVPSRVKRIQLDIRIAGRLISQSFPPNPNQSYTFVWDGKDPYGRTVQGSAKMAVSLYYVYPGYYNLPPSMASSFGIPSGQPVPGNVKSRADYFVRADQSVTLTVGAPPTQSIGGWSLSAHHRYDPIGKRLYLGDGRQRDVSNQIKDQTLSTIAGNGLRTVAGNGGVPKNASVADPIDVAVAADGSVYFVEGSFNMVRKVLSGGIISKFAGAGRSGFDGDGGLAVNANMDPAGIALDVDGNVYISGNNRVRKIDKNGIISTIAGNGQTGFSGDGGQATNAGLRYPSGIAVASDGTLFIADRDDHRIRRIGTDGVIQTIAGNGQAGFGGDGGAATVASLNNPNDIAIGPDGSLYIADKSNHRIRRIGPDGIITTVAGNGQPGGNGDGGLAIDAQLNLPNSLSIASDGGIYIADLGLGPSPVTKVRRIAPDGTIATVTGGGASGYGGEGSLATSENLRIFGIALGPDGSLLLGDESNFRVRQVSPLLPGYSHGDISIPSEDGAELYHFNASGRHLRTYDTLTGSALYTFAYDANGQLGSITDALGKITTIERDAQGKPTALVAPYGQRTQLATDGNGYLSEVSNPANERFVLTYGNGGLLSRFKNPLGNESTFTYSPEGLLLKDTNAQGGSISLARRDISDGHEVTVTTALGKTTTHQVQQTANGDLNRKHIQPYGTQMTTRTTSSGITQATGSDGTFMTSVEGPDPRFGMLAPLTKSITVTTGGLTATAAASQVATLSDANNPLSLTRLTDSIVVNGRISTTVYDALAKAITATSPSGRKSTASVDALGRVLDSQLGNLLPVNMTYDSQGRPNTISQGTGTDTRTVGLAYDAQGYPDTITDPLGRQISFDYDAVGRVTRQTLPDNRVIQYSYDANGNLTSLAPPGKPAHVFHYTQIDQTADYAPPDVGAGSNDTVYSYDPDKKPLRIDRPDGQVIRFAYDSAGRLASLNLGVPPSGQTLNSYSYQATTGKLAGITTGAGEALAYSYNQALLTGVAWSGEVSGSLNAGYNNDFRVTSLSVNVANPIAYSYDADSLLTKAGSLSLSHDSNGFLSATTLATLTDSYAYSGFGEMSRYTANFGANPLLDDQFSRDALGRITQKIESVNGGAIITYQYSYDNAGRLSQVKHDGVITASYTYDSNGNRLTAPNLSGTANYDDQDRLLNYGGTQYSYSANGELQSKTNSSAVTQYQYDVLGNLKQVVLPGGSQIDYVVDGRNRRIGKKRNGTLVQGFLYQDQLKPAAELDGNNQVVSRFVYATHANVPDYMIKGGVTYRIITDHLGSPRLIVNTANGTIAQRLDYDEWGNVMADSNPGFQPFGFAGGLYDRDTRLVRFGARDYDAVVGRWNAKDKNILFTNDLNNYSYANNNPIVFVDKYGASATLTELEERLAREKALNSELRKRIFNIRNHAVEKAQRALAEVTIYKIIQLIPSPDEFPNPFGSDPNEDLLLKNFEDSLSTPFDAIKTLGNLIKESNRIIDLLNEKIKQERILNEDIQQQIDNLNSCPIPERRNIFKDQFPDS